MVSTYVMLGGQSFPDIVSQVSLAQQLTDGQCRCKMDRPTRHEHIRSTTRNI